MTSLGSALRREREAHGIGLIKFSKLIGLSQGQVSKVELGKASIKASVVQKYDENLNAGGRLIALLPAEELTKSSIPAPSSGLPSPPKLFVGRCKEFARLIETPNPCSWNNLAVVSGLPGTGKTALALKAAEANLTRFGQAWGLYVDLRGHTPDAIPLSPGDAAYRLLTQLGVAPDQIAVDSEERMNTLRATLRGRRTVIVLDNAATAAQVRPLLVDSATCRVVVTSRNRLVGLEQALHVPLKTLAEAEAVELFLTATRTTATGEEQSIIDIVRWCGLLPLMIWIAAARFVTGNWTIARFHERLHDSATALIALNDGDRDVAAAFRMSFKELANDDRHVLALLATHPATAISVSAASSLTDRPLRKLDDVLDHLHDAHLVERDQNGDLSMHDLVRTCVKEHALPSVPEREQRAALLRLANHALGLASAADELIEPHRLRLHVEPSAPDSVPFTNAEQALHWFRENQEMLTGVACAVESDPLCWRLAHALRSFFFREKLFEPWITTNFAALRTARAEGNKLIEAMILNNLGMAYVEQGSLIEAAEHHAAAKAAFAQIGNRQGEIDALSSYAWVRLYQGAPKETVRDLGTALDSYRSAGHTRNTVIALRGLAFASADLKDHESALRYAQEAVALAQHRADLVLCLNCVAWTYFRSGDFANATTAYQEAVKQAASVDDEFQRTRALTGLGNTAAHQGNNLEAVAQWNLADASGITLNPIVVGESAVREKLAMRFGTFEQPTIVPTVNLESKNH